MRWKLLAVLAACAALASCDPMTTVAPSNAPATPTTSPTLAPRVQPAPPSSSAPPSPTCSIRSNAGNCYTPGEFCRNADVDKSTTDADGRTIKCTAIYGQPYWQLPASK